MSQTQSKSQSKPKQIEIKEEIHKHLYAAIVHILRIVNRHVRNEDVKELIAMAIDMAFVRGAVVEETTPIIGLDAAIALRVNSYLTRLKILASKRMHAKDKNDLDQVLKDLMEIWDLTVPRGE